MCISPVTLKQGSELVTFSCGRCFECVRKRKNDWVIRLHSEASSADVSFFCLISYNEENYPDPPKYDISAIQLLNKSLRMRLQRNFSYMRKDSSKPITLKYFIVSEYGETLNRLHYHAIYFLYNVKRTDCNFVFWKTLLENTWAKGFCSAFLLTQKTIVYTTKYIQKQYNMLLSSKGLGFEAYKSYHGDDVLKPDELDTYLINGKEYTCPRSWREKLRPSHHNTVASRFIADSSRNKPHSLSERERLLLHHKYVSDNPRLASDTLVKQDNSDILPNGEF